MVYKKNRLTAAFNVITHRNMHTDLNSKD